MTVNTKTQAQPHEKFTLSTYDRPIPKSGLQAAELEYEDYGKMKVVGACINYVDIMTRTVFLQLVFTSPSEARLQLEFYRKMYQDVLDRRAELRVVH